MKTGNDRSGSRAQSIGHSLLVNHELFAFGRVRRPRHRPGPWLCAGVAVVRAPVAVRINRGLLPPNLSRPSPVTPESHGDRSGSHATDGGARSSLRTPTCRPLAGDLPATYSRPNLRLHAPTRAPEPVLAALRRDSTGRVYLLRRGAPGPAPAADSGRVVRAPRVDRTRGGADARGSGPAPAAPLPGPVPARRGPPARPRHDDRLRLRAKHRPARGPRRERRCQPAR